MLSCLGCITHGSFRFTCLLQTRLDCVWLDWFSPRSSFQPCGQCSIISLPLPLLPTSRVSSVAYVTYIPLRNLAPISECLPQSPLTFQGTLRTSLRRRWWTFPLWVAELFPFRCARSFVEFVGILCSWKHQLYFDPADVTETWENANVLQ